MSFSLLKAAFTISLVFFSIIFSTGGKRAMAIEKPKYEVLRRNEVLIPVRKDSN
jgi:hypothetical protein